MLSRYHSVRTNLGGKSGDSVTIAKDRKSGELVVVRSCNQTCVDVYRRLNGVDKEAQRVLPVLLDAGVADKDHPDLCKKGRAYVITKLALGVTMRKYFEGDLPPFRDAMSVVFQVAFALHHLRKDLDVRHCDIHADNIIVDAVNTYGKDGRFALKGSKNRHVYDLTGCPKVVLIDFGLSERGESSPECRSFWYYLLRLYQLYIRPSDLTRVRLKIDRGGPPSPEMLRYMKGNRDACANSRSDLEAVLGFEDVLLGMYGVDGFKVPKTATYYKVLTSPRFDVLRGKGGARQGRR